jgi:hypothetical protein
MNTIQEKSNSMLEKSRMFKLFAGVSLIILSVGSVEAQEKKHSFGPLVGTYIPNIVGGGVAGDVVMIAETDSGDGERMIGGFYEFAFSPYLKISSEVTFTQQFFGIIIYNQAEQCTFCPVRKASGMAMNIIEFLPNAKLRILKFRKLELSLFGGVSAQLRLKTSPSSDISFGDKHPGVAETINQLDDGFKPWIGYLNYGLTLRYNRVFLTSKFQDMFGDTFAKEISLNDQKYPLILDSRNLVFTLGYRFYSLKRKKGK